MAAGRLPTAVVEASVIIIVVRSPRPSFRSLSSLYQLQVQTYRRVVTAAREGGASLDISPSVAGNFSAFWLGMAFSAHVLAYITSTMDWPIS